MPTGGAGQREPDGTAVLRRGQQVRVEGVRSPVAESQQLPGQWNQARTLNYSLSVSQDPGLYLLRVSISQSSEIQVSDCSVFPSLSVPQDPGL